jgi:hypothetical protein
VSINKVQGTGFAQIANSAIRDKRLSFKARGVLAMVLSHSGEWDAPRDWLEQQSDKDGKEAIQSALNELTGLGYRKVFKRQKPDGTWFTEVHWFQTPEEPVTEGRETRRPVDPAAGEPGLPPEHHLQNTSAGAALPPLPAMEGQIEEFALKAPVRSKPKDRATKMPEGFTPTPAMIEWTKANCPDIDPRREWTSFVNFHEAKGSRFVKWDAAWRTWANKAQGYAEQRKNTPERRQRAEAPSGVMIPADNYR